MVVTVVEAVDARRSLQTLPDQIPVGLRSALTPLLALDPDDRPARAERLFLSADRLGELPPLPTSTRSSRPAWMPRMLVVSGLLLLVLLGLSAYWIGAGRESTSSGTEDSEERVVSRTAGAEMEAERIPAGDTRGPDPAVAGIPSAPSALDELKIMGLLRGAQDALAEDRLRRPPGENAFAKYQSVLALDPDNEAAKQGLAKVAGRYLALARAALSGGDPEKAAHYLEEAVEVDSRHPGLASVQAELARAQQ